VAAHPWLRAATAFCLERAADVGPESHALVLRYVLLLLDALHDVEPRAASELDRIAALLPADATVPVAGGQEDEAMRPLDFAPLPGTPLRDRIDPAVIAADLDRLASMQADDGGWHVDFRAWSPAAALEWRGHATVTTVTALRLLIANGRAGTASA
jgi:hypothetical protein